MFGLPEALMSFIRRQVGLRTDVASATGSLHAKIKNIIAAELPKLQKPRRAVGGSFATSVTTNYQTGLSISGRGSLKFLGCSSLSGSSDYIKLTVDGNVMGWGRAIGHEEIEFLVPSPAFFMQISESGGGFEYNTYYAGSSDYGERFNYRAIGNGFIDIHFSTSLKIEVKHISNNVNTVHWIYDIE